MRSDLLRPLYDPKFATFKIGANAATFVVPSALVAGHSEYFRKALEGSFKEAQQEALALTMVEVWIFEIFVSWLYTQAIFYEPRDPDSTEGPGTPLNAVPESSTTDAVAREASESTLTAEESGSSKLVLSSGTTQLEVTGDRRLPVTWAYRHLMRLYTFADQYDNRPFRNAVMCLLQLKLVQRHPQSYPLPSFSEFIIAFEQSPESSKLYRLMLDVLVHRVVPNPARLAAYTHIPARALAECWVLTSRQKDRLRCKLCQEGKLCNSKHHAPRDNVLPLVEDVCYYHEHADDAEQALCRARWEDLKKRYGFKWI